MTRTTGNKERLNLPTAKAGGFLLHAALPTVVGLTRRPQAVLRLYDSHSDELLYPFVSQVVGCVLIPAVPGVALRAYPLAIGETEVFILVSAVGAQLG